MQHAWYRCRRAGTRCAAREVGVCAVLGLVCGLSHGMWMTTDRAEWAAATSGLALRDVDFGGFSDGAVIGDAVDGLVIGDGPTVVADPYFQDGLGLGGTAEIDMRFDTGHTALAIEFPGAITVSLFSDGVEVFNTGRIGGSGRGLFLGLVSETPFDSAVITDDGEDPVYIDAITFAPSPGAVVVIGACAVGSCRRRR